MSCLLTTTRRIRRAVRSDAPAQGGTAETGILDCRSPAIRALRDEIGETADLPFLRRAHGIIAARIRPVYSLSEARPASRVLARRRGSCSQRLAVLEAVARAQGIPTRTRGLLVTGRFWRPRFRALAAVLPERILIAWPQFLIDGAWLDASDLFEAEDPQPFTNAGAETLFDAIGRGGARWSAMRCDCDELPVDAVELGVFDSRDAFFRRYGQNLPHCIRTAAEPVFSRWSAGAISPLVA